MIRNFRDIGGIINKDGFAVRPGFFYRSARLDRLNEDDFKFIKGRNISKIYDLRTQYEVDKTPDVRVDGTEYIHWHLSDSRDVANDSFMQLRAKMITAKDDSERVKYIPDMKVAYTETVLVEYNRNRFIGLIRELCQCDKPVLWHCTSGKDRTGMTAATLLEILDVDREVIMQDYLESTENAVYEAEVIARKYAEKGSSDELVEAMRRMYLLDGDNLVEFFKIADETKLFREFDSIKQDFKSRMLIDIHRKKL